MRPDSEVKNTHTLQSKNNESEQLKVFFYFYAHNSFIISYLLNKFVFQYKKINVRKWSFNVVSSRGVVCPGFQGGS